MYWHCAFNDMVSCDSLVAIAKLIASIVVRVVANVWRMFIYSLVTNSLQLPASSIQFVSLVLVVFIIHDLHVHIVTNSMPCPTLVTNCT